MNVCWLLLVSYYSCQYPDRGIIHRNEWMNERTCRKNPTTSGAHIRYSKGEAKKERKTLFALLAIRSSLRTQWISLWFTHFHIIKATKVKFFMLLILTFSTFFLDKKLGESNETHCCMVYSLARSLTRAACQKRLSWPHILFNSPFFFFFLSFSSDSSSIYGEPWLSLAGTYVYTYTITPSSNFWS